MASYPLEGPDLSYAQGNANPANFPGQFAIINSSRANIGALAVGSYYRRQVDSFRAAGRHILHYFFNGSAGGRATPAMCAQFFVANLYEQPGDDYMLDVEDEPSTGTVHWNPDQVLAFDDVVFAARGKHLRLVYLNKSIRDAHDWSAVRARGIELHLAYYNPTLPAPDEWGDPLAWQYTSAGYDHNRARADLITATAGGATAPLAWEDDDMILITSPRNNYFVIGAGFSRQLRNTEELAAAQAIVTKTLVGNDRQVDLWNSIALAAPASAAITDAQLVELATSVASRIGSFPTEFNITGKASA